MAGKRVINGVEVTLKPLFRFSSSDGQVVTCVIIDDRKSLANGRFPIKVRVTYKRDRKYYSTGQDSSIEDWIKLERINTKATKELKMVLQKASARVREHVEALIDMDSFTFEKLNIRLSKGAMDTINTAFEARKELLKSEGRIGSFESYRTTLNSIERFSGINIPFTSITVDWLKQYDKWLRNNGSSLTTIGIYMRTLRAIVNTGKDMGMLKAGQYPFGTREKHGYVIPTSESRNLSLTIAEIGKIVKYECETMVESRCRDLWLFSYYCNGANFFDILRLKFKNIKGDEIEFFRKKTEGTAKKNKMIVAPLLPEMQTIVDRWGNIPKPDNYIFPFLTGKETPEDEDRVVSNLVRLVNKKMGIVGIALGIGKITTYTARHSYATVMKRSGANIAFISESLGHSDVKTTENYLAGFEKDERRKNAIQLTKFD